MTVKEITEEEIFSNDEDPEEAIAKIRREKDHQDSDSQDQVEEEQPQEETPAEEETQTTELESEKEEAFNLEEEEKASAAEGSNEKTEDEGEEPEKPNLRKYSANGQEYEFTEEEIFEKFGSVFGQAMNYTQKMQKIAPYRRMLSAMEEEGIDENQFFFAIDALKGKKEAIQQLLKTHNIDPLDIDIDIDNEQNGNTYSPTPYGKTETHQRIHEVTSAISSDKEYALTVDVIQNQWDDASKGTFAENPEYIQALHNDIKSGVYDKVAPIAAKIKTLDGNIRSDIEYYMLAGQQVTQQSSAEEKNQKAQADMKKSEKTSSEAARKRAAASTNSRADSRGITDYLDDNDENFEAWYKNLESKM